jgi:hypothetical protein
MTSNRQEKTRKQKMKISKQEEDNFNRLDDKIADLLHEVDKIVHETDRPTDYTEWKSAYFNWIVLIQARLSELSLYAMDHVEQHHVDHSTNEYFEDTNELKDSRKLQEHISK